MNATVVDNKAAGRDYLFTWKPGKRWPQQELRKLVETFKFTGIATEDWSCQAHKQIQPGDRAYLLQQGKPRGIFGRGHVFGKPFLKQNVQLGESRWQVWLRFDVLRDDRLCDPAVGSFLVNQEQLSKVSAPKKRWEHQAAGILLEATAAREIDDIINTLSVGQGPIIPVEGDDAEGTMRRMRLLQQLMRPEQRAFSETVRWNYRRKCAVTECVTSAALHAAHIRIESGMDYNSPANGILLRSDIHALFDELLITLSEDGTRIEVSPELADQTYAFLRIARVTRPDRDPPTADNIREHRKRFLDKQSTALAIR
jgi:hypothetical protein